MIESQRIDKWIWFARLIKSRTSAQNICKNGLVSVNGTVVKKPNHLVKVGDKLIIEFNYLKRILKIVSLGYRRGPFKEAKMLYEESITEGFHFSDLSLGFSRRSDSIMLSTGIIRVFGQHYIKNKN